MENKTEVKEEPRRVKIGRKVFVSLILFGSAFILVDFNYYASSKIHPIVLTFFFLMSSLFTMSVVLFIQEFKKKGTKKE